MAIAVPASSDRIRQKARGAFYTPPEITRFLAGWAIRSASDRVLEPSCGDGAFLPAVAERFAELGRVDLGDQLTAVERDPDEATKAQTLAAGGEVLTSDFFDIDSASRQPFDVVIGNPPYIRYHGFFGEDREKGLGRAREQGVELTRLASSWAHFVVHSIGFLAPEGRLALVLPAELLHADYGQPVRDLLLRRFDSVVVLAFDHLVFSEAQVDAVLVLASNDSCSGLQVVRAVDERELGTIDLGGTATIQRRPGGRWSGALDFEAGLVYEQAIASGVAQRLGEIASVDIGYVSGANSFFVMTGAEAGSRRIPASALTRTIRRPADVPGLIATEDQAQLLLDLSGKAAPSDRHLLAYLAEGEAAGIAGRYKCRVRKPWYAVPLPRSRPDAFLPYMNHQGPRLIVNGIGAWSSNLLHGVSLNASAPAVTALAAAMCSSLTLLSGEVEGRAYGGGVLKLETREAERLAVPLLDAELSNGLHREFGRLNSLRAGGRIEDASTIVDDILGLDHRVFWAAFSSFRDRRLGRRNHARRRYLALDGA